MFSPRPVKPSKRPLSDLDPECAPARKQARLSPFPWPSPPTKEQPSKVLDPSRHPSSASSWLKSASKRPLEDINSDCTPPYKYRRLQSPSPTQLSNVPRSISAPPWPSSAKRAFRDFDFACGPTSKHSPLPSSACSPIDAWLSEYSHLDSCPSSPPISRPRSCSAAIDLGIYTPVSLADIKQMTQQNGETGLGSVTSRSEMPTTSHHLYRATLYNNYVTLDYSGRQIPEELRKHINTRILKQPESPELDDDSVSKVIKVAEELAESAEGPTMKLLRTAMFPIERDGIGEGGNTQWNIVALPNNPEYAHNLSAPKPDVYLGYSCGQRSGWSIAQENVINHVMARPYTQPARGNTFPFFMIEMKSEPAGGTLYVAENQAAGSGSHSVNALLWLHKEAGLADNISVIDTVVFSAAVSHRQAIFYIHWYSKDDSHFYMSYLKSYSTMERQDIRACNGIVTNIINDALGTRKKRIGSNLEALSSPPEHWKRGRPKGTSRSASRNSLTEDPRPNKIQRRSETQQSSPAWLEG